VEMALDHWLMRHTSFRIVNDKSSGDTAFYLSIVVLSISRFVQRRRSIPSSLLLLTYPYLLLLLDDLEAVK